MLKSVGWSGLVLGTVIGFLEPMANGWSLAIAGAILIGAERIASAMMARQQPDPATDRP